MLRLFRRAESEKVQRSILIPDTSLSEPIEGLDSQGIPIGDNVPPATDGSVPLADSQNQPEEITQPIELSVNPKNTNEPTAQESKTTIPATPESATDETVNNTIQQTKEGEGEGVVTIDTVSQ